MLADSLPNKARRIVLLTIWASERYSPGCLLCQRPAGCWGCRRAAAARVLYTDPSTVGRVALERCTTLTLAAQWLPADQADLCLCAAGALAYLAGGLSR